MVKMIKNALFRGQALHLKPGQEDRWVYGYYAVFQSAYSKAENHTIIQHGAISNRGDDKCVKVYPETVGQFIGQCDINGNKIFEGDILDWTQTHPEDDPCPFEVVWTGRGFGKRYLKSHKSIILSLDYTDIEFGNIVGNIHDMKKGQSCQE